MALLIPTILIYGYSNQVTIQVIKDDINERNINRLEASVNRLESDLDQLSQSLVALSIDPDVNQARNIDLYSRYEALVIKEKIFNKLSTYQQLSRLKVDVTVYIPENESVISTLSNFPESPKKLSTSWSYVNSKKEVNNQPYFLRHIRYPAGEHEIGDEAIIEARVYIESIQNHLADLTTEELNNAFYYHEDYGTIDINSNDINSLNLGLHDNFVDENGSVQLSQNNMQYLISYVQVESLGWTLIDYVPLKEVLTPVYTSQYLLYGSVIFMILGGLFFGRLLYKDLHVPIQQLKNGVSSIKRANYSVRMESNVQNEFSSLMDGFNKMAEQIQNLFEQVYSEKLRSKDASLKLLQAQIDPHFLYNCLFYIKNMAKVNQTEAVEAMALHLGNYFRYRTKVEEVTTTLEEEIGLIRTFLSIHALRKRSLSYSISISEDFESVVIPRLLIQPIVENAIIHGTDRLNGCAEIKLTGGVKNGFFFIAIDDNGIGLTETRRNQLQRNLEEDKEQSYGMRNVHQRLKGIYGVDSGLIIQKSELGGLRVVLQWRL